METWEGTYDSLEDVVLGLEDELEVLLQVTTLELTPRDGDVLEESPDSQEKRREMERGEIAVAERGLKGLCPSYIPTIPLRLFLMARENSGNI